MKLKDFILRLEKIKDKYGDEIRVVMADGINVVNPVYIIKNDTIVITDE